jgi:hypothetical protein
MHLDPAIKRDAYGLAFGHVENNETGEKIVIIDGILAWEPDPETQVSITNVQSCVYQIHNARPIFKLSADHAQSDETIQRLKAAGISAEAIFFSNRRQVEMYDATRKLMHEDRLILPKNSPWTGLLTDELLYVQHDKETKIDHMPGRTKDVADAVCAVVWRLLSMHSLLTANEFGKVEIRANKNHTDFQKLEEN